jgi:c(7)-type cytochrome triheme protein
MRTLSVLSVLLFALTAVAFAVPAGKTLVFDKSPQGKVIFDGAKHAEAGFKCTDCHNKDIFPKMKKGSTEITMDAIRAGKLCGSCHNGNAAFQPEGNCTRCHKK